MCQNLHLPNRSMCRYMPMPSLNFTQGLACKNATFFEFPGDSIAEIVYKEINYLRVHVKKEALHNVRIPKGFLS